MAHVSLIVLDSFEGPEFASRLAAWRVALERAGHEVEALVVGLGDEPGDVTGARFVASAGRGQSTDAALGLRRATGDYRLIVDAARAYEPEDFPRLVEALVAGPAEVAVADGRPGGWRRLFALGLRPLTRSSDPFSGLIGLSADASRQADPVFRPVGRRFALEILARTRGGRPVDVPVSAARSRDFPAFQVDDFRHIKRLADDTLGNVSRLIQFCVVGASGMVVDLSFYALFQWTFSRSPLAWGPTVMGAPMDLAAAGALSIALALTWNFTLNRHLTFSYAKKGDLVRQFVTYVLSNALGIALSFTLRLTLPRTIGYFARHKLAAAVVGIVAATGISFTMSRWLVFRPRRPTSEPAVGVGPPSVPAPSSTIRTDVA